jgi:hypothetical protein
MAEATLGAKPKTGLIVKILEAIKERLQRFELWRHWTAVVLQRVAGFTFPPLARAFASPRPGAKGIRSVR